MGNQSLGSAHVPVGELEKERMSPHEEEHRFPRTTLTCLGVLTLYQQLILSELIFTLSARGSMEG